jgi:GNAT superfamily N-acetyltransferase
MIQQRTQIIADNRSASYQPVFKAMPPMNRLHLLENTDQAEVLEFLSLRPVHTVVMKSFIQDNGLQSTDNRGQFYGYRASDGSLEGVALIGHTTLIEARSDNAVVAFALQARISETPLHIIMSDTKTTERFWKFFAVENQQPRLSCTELLFELNFPFLVQQCKWDVRTAKPEEIEQIAEVHAEVAFIESGVNPMEKDREGFLRRTMKRIENRRTFVVFKDEKLIFKADIVAETSETIYLEGIYVAPEYRGKGVGADCLAAVSLELMNRAENICLLSNVEFKSAHCSFAKAGFKNTDSTLSMFV